MTDCNETLRELESFLDGELTDGDRSEITSHVSGCPDCHQAFDFHAELKAVIAVKCHQEELPPGLIDKIRACFDVDVDDTSSI
jgi:anti-sigma factor (TIGR02949 family)